MSPTAHQQHQHLNVASSTHLCFCCLCFCSLKEFLPKEYIKQRGAEKKVFQVCTSLISRNSVFQVNELNTSSLEPAGAQKRWRNDGDRSKSEVREAGALPADVRRLLLPGQGKMAPGCSGLLQQKDQVEETKMPPGLLYIKERSRLRKKPAPFISKA